MTDGSLSKNKEKSNAEVFDTALKEFFNRVDIIHIAYIFFNSMPTTELFSDESEEWQETKKGYKGICLLLKEDIKILSVSVDTMLEVIKKLKW